MALGGTLKEFQGDALFAFWEKGSDGCHACQACDAALRLKQLVGRLAADPAVWSVAGHPLEMDFALSTGMVTISGYGSEGALGLSMVGESVVLAYRIEKFANRSTGPIIVCPDHPAAGERRLQVQGPRHAARQGVRQRAPPVRARQTHEEAKATRGSLSLES